MKTIIMISMLGVVFLWSCQGAYLEERVGPRYLTRSVLKCNPNATEVFDNTHPLLKKYRKDGQKQRKKPRGSAHKREEARKRHTFARLRKTRSLQNDIVTLWMERNPQNEDVIKIKKALEALKGPRSMQEILQVASDLELHQLVARASKLQKNRHDRYNLKREIRQDLALKFMPQALLA